MDKMKEIASDTVGWLRPLDPVYFVHPVYSFSVSI
jgi:hypothetical protein